MDVRPTGAAALSNPQLLRYAVAVAGGLLVVHLYIAVFAENRVDKWSMLLLGVVALYVAWFQWSRRRQLRQRAYGRYLLHVLTYLLVNGSYWLHAGLLAAAGNSNALDSSWQGALFGMSLIWGVGLLVHTLGALLSKGYENVSV